MLVMLAVMLTGMWLWRSNAKDGTHSVVDYSVFYVWVEAAKIESVVFEGARLQGKLRAPETVKGQSVSTFHTIRPDRDDALLPLLRSKGVRIRVDSEQRPFAIQLLMNVLPWLLIIGVWVWMSRNAQKMMAGGGPLAGILKTKNRKFEKSAAVGVTFDDVAGLTAAKRDLMEIVAFLKEPERFQRLGGKVPRGVLLVGPPGTGKTLLARAVAGESGVPFYSISASEFIEMFVGVGAARVRELFQEAKKNAPAIIFIDEIDAVGRARGAGLGGGNDEREQTLNQLLSEMDGFNRNDLAVVLAATNRPDVLDPALLRPGRFDRRVIIDRPEVAARRAILDVHAKNKPLGADVDLDSISRNTPGFSGADLANLVNEAALHATRRSADAIEAPDFAEAYDKIVLGDASEAKLGAEEKKRVAVHESGHAVAAAFSPHAESLHRVSIIPRGMALGVTQQTPADDRHILTEPQLWARLRVLMGGYAAERLVFQSASTGAENDLKEATKLASKMVAQYGMSERFGPVYYEYDVVHPFLGQRIATDGGASDATTHAIEDEARVILATALTEASALLEAHLSELDTLVEVLLDKETIEKGELVRLFGAGLDSDQDDAARAPSVAAATKFGSSSDDGRDG